MTLDGKLIFSKKALGRFPETREILEKIPPSLTRPGTDPPK